MTAILFVLICLSVAIVCLVLWLTRNWRLLALAGLILAFLGMLAEGPRAAAELWGSRLPGVVAATEESLRLETVRSSGSRTTHYNPRHRFGAIVCYRAAGTPGLGAGAPIDPAIQATIGEAETNANRLCRAVPGVGVLRQTEIRLDAATYDATNPGQVVTLTLLRPFGLLEWAWSVDAPLLPWLPRPNLGGGGPRVAVAAQVVSITIDPHGRTLLSRRAHPYAVPIAHVRLRYAPPGHPAGVEGVDSVDAPSVAHLAAGSPITITVAADAPRTPLLVGVTRSYWWRNFIGEALVAIGIIGVFIAVIAVIAVIRRRRRLRGATS